MDQFYFFCFLFLKGLNESCSTTFESKNNGSINLKISVVKFNCWPKRCAYFFLLYLIFTRERILFVWLKLNFWWSKDLFISQKQKTKIKTNSTLLWSYFRYEDVNWKSYRTINVYKELRNIHRSKTRIYWMILERLVSQRFCLT